MNISEKHIVKDGKEFDSIFACMKHDLITSPEMVKKINLEYQKVGEYFTWFEPGQCGDGGHASYIFSQLGLTKEHFEIWSKYFKSSINEEGYDIFKPMKINLIETSSRQKFILYLNQHIYFYQLKGVDIYKKLKNNIIFESNEYFMIKNVCEYLSKYEDIKFKVTN